MSDQLHDDTLHEPQSTLDPYLDKLIEPPVPKPELLKKCRKGERVLFLIRGVLSREQHGELLAGMYELRARQAVRRTMETCDERTALAAK